MKKKIISYLIKSMPVDFIKNNPDIVDGAVDVFVDKDPVKLVRAISKYVPIEAIQKNPALLERFVQAVVNEDTQQLRELINEISGNAQNVTLSEAQRIEILLSNFAQEIANSPEKLVAYTFEFGIEALSSICKSINDLKILDIRDKISEILVAKDMLEIGYSNPTLKRDKLLKAQEALLYVYRKLEDRFDFYLNEIKELDNLPDWKFYLFQGPIQFIKGDIDTNNKIAQLAINGIIQTVNLQIIISHELNVNINSSVIKNFNELCNKIQSSSACDLLHAYDKNKQDEFWLKLSEKLDITVENKTLLIECLES